MQQDKHCFLMSLSPSQVSSTGGLQPNQNSQNYTHSSLHTVIQVNHITSPSVSAPGRNDQMLSKGTHVDLLTCLKS